MAGLSRRSEMPNRQSQPPAILVADDNADFVQLVSLILKRQGYRVIPAEDGSEALEVLLHEPIDLALLDVNMPHWNGFSLCRIVKSNPQTRLTPVVLVTGLTSMEDRIEGIQSGADEFLSKPVSKEELLARIGSLLKLKQFTDELENAETVVFSLARSIEAKDPYTHGHCDRLSGYAVALAEKLDLPEEQRVALRRAGIVHDVGKVAVPDQILLKPGPLTPEERQVMERHPLTGERICAPLKSFRHVTPIIRHHHERLDGSGYPDGLRGDDIPLTARILTTVDVYDALTTPRPYREALPPERALTVMREEIEHGWLEESLVEAFEDVLAHASRAVVG